MSGRSYEDRLDTISNVREAGISVCCGGILGLGEVSEDGDQEELGFVLISACTSASGSTHASLLIWPLSKSFEVMIIHQWPVGCPPWLS